MLTGLELRNLRERLGITTGQLARVTGYHPSHIRQVENGQRMICRRFVLVCLGGMRSIQSDRSQLLETFDPRA